VHGSTGASDPPRSDDIGFDDAAIIDLVDAFEPASTRGHGAKIRKLRAQGMSLQAIADELNRLRYPTARGGATWRPSSVHSVLSCAS
jgi:hypothetical protein